MQSANSSSADRILLAAHRLAKRFTDAGDLPARFRGKAVRQGGQKRAASVAEKKYQVSVESWKVTLATMVEKLGDDQQAWRFIEICPILEPTKALTEHRDFRCFLDYMILRREVEGCTPDELGALALLSVEVQRALERKTEIESESE